MFMTHSIVAVDDSGIVLKTLEVMLGRKYEFRGFSKAERAFNFMMQTPPSLVILDIDMPEINGYQMLEMIKEKEKLKNIPVIFLTSNNEKSSVMKAVKYGADAYVVKPIDNQILLSKIEALLKDKAAK